MIISLYAGSKHFELRIFANVAQTSVVLALQSGCNIYGESVACSPRWKVLRLELDFHCCFWEA